MSLKHAINMAKNWLQTSPHSEKLKSWGLPALLTLLGTLMLFQGVRSHKAKLGYNMKPQVVLIASKALAQGHVLKESDFAEQNVPEKLLPLGALTGSDRTEAIGQMVNRPVPEGRMIFWSDLDVNFMPAVPASRISKGYRALSISVSETTSVAHSIRAGDHIDLIGTLLLPGEEGTTTLTLLQNVTVLDVGSSEEGEGGKYTTVTLMVLPKEVPLITHAAEQGKLNVVLRSPEDGETPKNLPLVAMNQLVETGFRNSIQDERNSSVQIIRGGKSSTERPLP
jgi:pilus assembly protein CpaB